MTLIELQPTWIKYNDLGWQQDVPFAEAQGILFFCPLTGCDHMVGISFADKGVSDHQGSHSDEGKPSRWTATGTDFSSLTLTPSVWLKKGCGWHGFITDGKVLSV